MLLPRKNILFLSFLIVLCLCYALHVEGFHSFAKTSNNNFCLKKKESYTFDSFAKKQRLHRKSEFNLLSHGIKAVEDQSPVKPVKKNEADLVNNLQTVDFTTLALICRELESLVVPARFQDAYQLDGQNLAISLRTLDGNRWLYFSWNPKAARMTLGDPPPKTKERKTYSLSQQIKNSLAGLNLVRISIASPFERIAVLDFSERPENEPTFRLYLEVMAARSNLVLVSGEDSRIATCAYQVSPSKSSRPLQTAQEYQLPPPQTKPAPSLEDPSLETFQRQVGLIETDKLAAALTASYKGVSPVLARAMASAVGIPPNTKIGSLSNEQWALLYNGPWRQWLRIIIQGEAVKPLVDWEKFTYVPIFFDGLEEQSDSSMKVDDGLEKLLQEYYGLAQMTVEHTRLKQKCLQKLSGVLSKVQSRVEDFQSQLTEVEAGKAEEHQYKADLLTAYTHTWKKGDPEVNCEDFTTGSLVKIPIPEGQTPVEVAQSLYKKSKKLKRSVEVVKPLLEQAETLLEYLEGVEFAILDLKTCKGYEDLVAIQEISDEIDAEGGGLLQSKLLFANRNNADSSQQQRPKLQKQKNKKGGKGNKGNPAKKKGKEQPPSKKQTSLDGILKLRRTPESPLLVVGRNSMQNERISFKIAKDHELWFHARGVAGSHCLLRCEPGAEVKDKDIQFAADVAAYFSKGRGSSSIPVSCTSPQNIKKITGGPPGMVHITKEDIIWAKPGSVDPSSVL